VLRRRWWLIAACGFIGLSTGWYTNRGNAPIYSASAVVQREAQKSPLEGIVPTATPNMVSEMEIIRGTGVIGPAVDSVRSRVQLPGHTPRSKWIAEVKLAPDAASAIYSLVPRGNLVLLTASGS